MSKRKLMTPSRRESRRQLLSSFGPYGQPVQRMFSISSIFGKARKKREARITRVQVLDDSFSVSADDHTTQRVGWQEIERIFTYKVDCFAYDTIWLAFQRQANETDLHVPEDAAGFQDLMSAMAKHFPSIAPEWYGDVMLPPFAANFTMLFDRQQGSKQ